MHVHYGREINIMRSYEDKEKYTRMDAFNKAYYMLSKARAKVPRLSLKNYTSKLLQRCIQV